MAEHAEVEYATATGNDYPAHEHTYRNFVTLVKATLAIVVVIVILMARGRDAADVAIATTFGAHKLKQFVVRTDELVTPTAPRVEAARAASRLTA